MKLAPAVIAALLLAGCGTHAVTLMPRHTGQQGVGAVKDGHELTVDLEGRRYVGKVQWQDAIATTTSPLGFMSTTRMSSDQASAVLLSDGAHMRCDFTLSLVSGQGSGVCVDNRNLTYDLLVK